MAGVAVASSPPPPPPLDEHVHDDDMDVDEDKLLRELFGDAKDSPGEPVISGEPDMGTTTVSEEKSVADENFDAFLDQAIQKEISPDTISPAESEKTETAVALADKEDDLDRLLDNILISENEAGVSPSSQPEATLPGEEVVAVKEQEPALDNREDDDTEDILADLLTDEDVSPDKKTSKSDKTMAEDTLNQIMAEADDEGDSGGKPAEAGPETGEGKENEDALWAQAFAEQNELNKEMKAEEAPAPAAQEESEDALWAKAFAEQESLNKELKQGEPLTAPEGGGEDALWAKAFSEQEELNKKTEAAGETAVAAEEEAGEDTEKADEETEKEGGEDETEEGEEESEESEEETEEEEETATDEEEETEEEEEPERKKLGPIPLPTSTIGKLLVGAGLVAVLLTGAGVYFGIKTFVPPELMQKIPFLKKFVHEEAKAPAQPTEAEVAEKPGATLDEAAPAEGEAAKAPEKDTAKAPVPAGPKPEEAPKPEEPSKAVEAPKTEEAPKTAAAPATGEVQKPAEAPATAEAPKPAEPPKPGEAAKPGESPKEDIGKALESALGGEKVETEGEIESVAPKDTYITLMAIMPVAFNINDIRILTFNLEIELDNEATTKLIREALPVYEKIMVATVEKFLANKFFNDILYVREKLQKELQVGFNKNIQGGKVKKTKFKDFLVQ